jgi:predicted O-methyltransferase YrrM
MAMARQVPAAVVTVLEIPPMTDLARSWIAEQGLQGRVEVMEGDMFDGSGWPSGYNRHFLSNMCHDWAPEAVAKPLSHSFDSLVPGGTVVLHEMLLDEDGVGPPEGDCLLVHDAPLDGGHAVEAE